MIMRIIFFVFVILFSSASMASDAEILDVKTELTPAQKMNFTVTIKHADTGWEHYANAFRVYTPDGELLGERILHHPHVKEQPFTRTLAGISIPAEVNKVIIKANCSKTNENKKGYTVKLR